MADSVTQFHDISMQLVNEAINYAKANVFNAETDANIRQVRTISMVLMAALQQASAVQRPSSFTPPHAPEEAPLKRKSA